MKVPWTLPKLFARRDKHADAAVASEHPWSVEMEKNSVLEEAPPRFARVAFTQGCNRVFGSGAQATDSGPAVATATLPVPRTVSRLRLRD